ncbi:MAG: ABC transporter permease [Phycisphaerales bacterium]
MRAAWRLATSSLSARRTRTALLCACVAMCAALVCAISCAVSSINAGLEQRISETVGAADVRIVHPGQNLFDAGLVAKAQTWPGVTVVGARLRDSMAFKNLKTGKDGRVLVTGVMPDRERKLRPLDMAAGRLMEKDDEAVLDVRTAETLGLSVGDQFEVVRFGDSARMTVVGTVKPPPLSEFIGAQQPAYFTLAALQKIGDFPGKVHEIEIMLDRAGIGGGKSGSEEFVAAHRAEVPRPLFMQSTARATSGFASNRQTSQVALVIASVFAFIASSFIIATGMTTGVTERVRELAVLRCIGAMRRQLAAAQLMSGMLVGVIGACVGLPIGILGSAWLVSRYPQQLPGGFALSWPGVTVAALGSIAAGMIGAAWSAWNAARVTPLEGLAARAELRGRARCGSCSRRASPSPACTLWSCSLSPAAMRSSGSMRR